jgi:hypothetical protein
LFSSTIKHFQSVYLYQPERIANIHKEYSKTIFFCRFITYYYTFGFCLFQTCDNVASSRLHNICILISSTSRLVGFKDVPVKHSFSSQTIIKQTTSHHLVVSKSCLGFLSVHSMKKKRVYRTGFYILSSFCFVRV